MIFFNRKLRQPSQPDITLAATGTWSVRLTTTKTFIAQGINEERAWQAFLATLDDAELLNGTKVMSHRKGSFL